MIKIATTIFVGLFAMQALAQYEGHFKCATDEMHQLLYETRPDIVHGALRAHQQLKDETENFTRSVNRSQDPYIIPVVFHIIHNYGVENIDNAQILDGLRQANIQLRKQNADTVDIVGSFEGIAADVEIELRLAQLDPDGNCTSGITRHVSPLTYIGDHEVKNIVQWPPDQYLNVYVCNQAAGLAGHALLPHAADTVPQWDGIVMQHSYVGTVGTSNFFRRTVLTHEIGHYLNLQHIWGGNNVPNYYYLPVGQSSNCDHDDEVEDTPLTIGWQSCNLSGVTCGSLDNVQNYMDYAYCALMFTEGQRDRMHACLNSSVANRNNLWSAANLTITGTDGATNYLCGAQFNATKRIACVGETIELSDVSYHGVVSREWLVTGGQLSSPTDSVVTIVFNQPGRYSVSLTVSDGINELTTSETDWLVILPGQGEKDYIIEDAEDQGNFDSRWVVVDQGTPINWEITTPGKASNQSLFIENINGPLGAEYIFQSQPIDASQLDAIAVQFDYAFSKQIETDNDVLQVQISNNCGETWVTRRTLTATAMESNDGPTLDYFEPNPDEWKTNLIEIFTAQYLVEDLLFRFRFASGGGNNIYLDNINIGHPASLYLVSDVSMRQLELYPNPSSDVVYIRTTDEEVMSSIQVYNAQGQLLVDQKMENQSEQLISTELWSKGVYMIRIQTNQTLHHRKLMKQ
jgi:PKD repeat protein